MDWAKSVKSRYATNGWDALREADAAFKKRLEQFIAAHALAVIDNNPEGEDWMVRLKDGQELYVDRRSYDLEDGKSFWIEYQPDRGDIIAEFFDAEGQPAERIVLIAKSEIADASNDWR